MKLVPRILIAAMVSLAAVGCAQQPKAANSSEAIKQAMSMETVEAQAQYLVQQAKAFAASEKYQDAINSAQYVVANLNVEAEIAKAKKIIEDAKAQLEAQAKAAMGDAKSKLGL